MSVSEQLREAYSKIPDIDQAILQSAILGDEDAKTHMVEFYKQRIHSYFFYSEIPFDEIEDCGQDVWAKVFKKLPEYEIRENIPFGIYLFKTTKSVKMDYYRNHDWPAEFIGAQVEICCTHPFSNPERFAEVTEQYEAIQRQIERIGPEKAQAFYNHYVLGLDHSTSAGLMNTSIDNVRQLSSRGRREIIKAIMSEESPDSC